MSAERDGITFSAANRCMSPLKDTLHSAASWTVYFWTVAATGGLYLPPDSEDIHSRRPGSLPMLIGRVAFTTHFVNNSSSSFFLEIDIGLSVVLRMSTLQSAPLSTRASVTLTYEQRGVTKQNTILDALLALLAFLPEAKSCK
jgi:hypothetical protein